MNKSLKEILIGSSSVKITGMIFSFAVGVLLARTLGIEEYGIYGLVMSIMTIVGIPLEMGIPQLVVKEVAVSQAKKNNAIYFSINKWCKKIIVTSTFILFVLIMIIPFDEIFNVENQSFNKFILLGFITVPLIAFLKLISANLRGLQFITLGQIPDSIIRPLLFSLFLVLAPFFLKDINVENVILLSIFSLIITYIVSWIILVRHEPKFYATTNKIEYKTKEWVSTLIPMALTEGIRVIQSQVVVIVLGVMALSADVGAYKVASSIMLLATFPTSVINVSLSPIIARLHVLGELNSIERSLKNASIIITFISFMLFMFFYFVGDWFFITFFGDSFTSVNSVFLILCFGIVLNGLFGTPSIVLNMSGYQNVVSLISFLSLFLLLIISPLLIYYFSAYGGAIAFSACSLIWYGSLWYFANKKLGISTSFLFCSV